MITEKIDILDKKAKEGADKAYDTFDSARQEARDLADQAVETGQQGFRQARESAKKMWNQARKTGAEWGERVAESSQENLDNVKNFAKNRPLQTAAIALALGVVIGGLIVATYQER